MAAFVVFDVSRVTTFESTRFWKKDIDDKINQDDNIPVILIANKIDLVEDSQILNTLDDYCKDYGFTTWFATSAKNNINIGGICEPIVNFILNNKQKLVEEKERDLLNNTRGGMTICTGEGVDNSKKCCQ